ncbi:MAG: hypothetical protein ACI9H8_000407 [Lysobacterales bacterium]|jgi:hypothetical protein
MNILKKLSINAICLVTVLCASIAYAHTTSIGFTPGANQGEVIFYTGSYHPNVGVNEGTLTLTGINGTVYGPTELAFNIPSVNVKPAGLVDGTNNCYVTIANLVDCTLLADPIRSGPVIIWQGVTFAGLQAGDYSFSCGTTCGTSDIFNSLGTGSGVLTLTSQTVGGNEDASISVPTLSLAGVIFLLGLIAITAIFYRRRLNA